MVEFFEVMGTAAPYYLPILAAILTIVFTKAYVYRDMIPQKMLDDQIAREQTRLTEQADREKSIIEGAKDIENQLDKIDKHLETLVKKVSEEIRANTDRIGSLERFMSDFIGEVNNLAHQCEMHRKGVPGTEVYRQPRGKEKDL
jgi:peptidoglycan hydrolase CwlO-like protein